MTTAPVGAYHLLYYLPRETRLRIGALGEHTLRPGWYVYTGSAFGPGGLPARVGRHRRQSAGAPAKPHWHVDYLAGAADLVDAVLLPDTRRRECEHARAIRDLPGSALPVPGFGASDCRCPAHLAYFAERPFLPRNPAPDADAPGCGMDAEEVELLAAVDAVLARRFAAMGDLALRVGREIFGDAVDAVRRQQRAEPRWSPRALARGLERLPIPDLAWVRGDPHARRFAGAYLRLAARAVVLNQIEARIRQEFQGLLHTPPSCYAHTESLVAALSFLNARAAQLDEGIASARLDAGDLDLGYQDRVRDAILLADALYDSRAAEQEVIRLEQRRLPGGTPMGAEMEFSALGVGAVRARRGADATLDGLHYFHDFALGQRLRLLGGYRDDHTGASFDAGRSRGFLEVAPGRLQVDGDLSQPATTDVGILDALIRESVEFLGIAPHSLHVTLQAREGRSFTRLESPETLFCLLLLGGCFSPDADGAFRERRIHDREIRDRQGFLAFSRLNAHAAAEGAPPTRVVEFTFPRLARGRSYEALILALKGFQWATNPLPLVAPASEKSRRYYREMAGALEAWAAEPRPVSESGIAAFIERIALGLQEECVAGQGHLREAVAIVESALREANDALRRLHG